MKKKKRFIMSYILNFERLLMLNSIKNCWKKKNFH